MMKEMRFRDSQKLQLAVLDDHPVLIWAIVALLDSQYDMNVVFSNTQVDPFLKQLVEQPCGIVVVDFAFPEQRVDGSNLVRRIRRLAPKTRVLVFSATVGHEIEYATYKAGASGFISKTCPHSLLTDAIRELSEKSTGFLCARDEKLVNVIPTRDDEALTIKEVEVLRQLANGLNVSEIANKLLRSPKTISSQKRNAMRKLNLTNELQLANYLQERFNS